MVHTWTGRTIITLLVFFFIQLLLIARGNGPHYDEGLYSAAGARILDGYGMVDGYASWFYGYPFLWPVFASLGYKLAGLEGTRFVALLFSSIALIATALSTRNLFGEKIAFWTVLALTMSGAFMATAHMGVYDPMSQAFLMVAFYAITKLWKSNNHHFASLAGVMIALGFLAKYPLGILFTAPLIVLVIILRGRKSIGDILRISVSALIVVGIAAYIIRSQLPVLFSTALTSGRSSFGISSDTLIIMLVFFGLSGILAPVGWWVTLRYFPHKIPMITTLLFMTIVLPIGYHLFTGDPNSDRKHIATGFLFGFPLVGIALCHYWENRRKDALISLVLLFLLGVSQIYYQERNWPDVRRPAYFLTDHVKAGDKLLVTNHGAYMTYLLNEKNISPFDVTNEFSQKPQNDLCKYNWWVNQINHFDFSKEIRDGIKRCDTFELVYRGSTVTSKFTDSGIYMDPVGIEIWKNVPKKEEPVVPTSPELVKISDRVD